MTGRRRAWAPRASTLGVVVALVVLAAPPAWSHSELERSDPPNGGMVTPGTTTLRLWFGDPVIASASLFELHTADGGTVEVRTDSASATGTEVRLETGPLPVGTYQLDWRTLSQNDGHTSNGVLAFGSGLRPGVVPSAGDGLPEGSLLVLQWVDLTAILLTIGALVVGDRVLGRLGEAGRAPRRRARQVGVLAAFLAVYAGLLAPFLRALSRGTPLGTMASEAWGILSGTPWGHLWLAREAALVLAAASVWTWSRRPMTRNRVPAGPARVALVALAAAALLEALAGHASTLTRLPAVAALMSAAHIVAAGVWAGGLGVLAVSLVPLARRDPAMRNVVISTVWRGFGPAAAVSSVVLVATGLYEAGRHLPDVASLTGTVYGGAVGAKVLLLALALATAGLNLMLVHPRAAARLSRALRRPPGWTPLPRNRFSTLVVTECLVLFSAVGLAAVLTTVPTAREVRDADLPTAPQSATADGLFITFEDIAAGPERSRIVVRVRSVVLPAPAPVVGVDVELSGPSGARDPIRLDRVDEGRFEAGTPVSAPGAWTATLRLHRPGLPDTVTRTRWTVAPASGANASPLEVVGSVLATLLLVGLATTLALVRRRREDDPPAVVQLAVPEREVSLR